MSLQLIIDDDTNHLIPRTSYKNKRSRNWKIYKQITVGFTVLYFIIPGELIKSK